MTEQSSGWGLTVSRRFEASADADTAVQSLKSAGFRDEEMRVWQLKKPSSGTAEDALERTFEGLLTGGVIGGLIGLFVTTSYVWVMNERVTVESPALGTLAGAVAGAVIVALGVTALSRKIRFQRHEHHAPDEAPTVVTVTVGDREAQAKQVFDGTGG